jgi:hypothetical protein
MESSRALLLRLPFPTPAAYWVWESSELYAAAEGLRLVRQLVCFFDSVSEKPTMSGGLQDKTGIAVASLILGILGLVAWFIPLAGFPVTITGFMLGRKARLSSQRGLALTGMGLSLLGLLLSAGNAYLGAMMTVRAGMESHRQ